MKSQIILLLAFALSSLGGVSYGQTAYQKELDQLVEYRDKALAAAAAPINERFQSSAQQLLRRATQAGDLEGATKIKEAIEANARSSREGIKDIKKELVGTTWKCAPGKPVRGGLGPTFTFTEAGVQPGGFKYEVDRSNTVTITFNQGGTQVMTLTKGGSRLEFSLGATDHVYELVRK
ncbi:MAG TPA: hypothetical protein VD994_02865 [Prosthecobacter sp.]|nr:hypothetical protein [Prosthecobacter sp.]